MRHSLPHFDQQLCSISTESLWKKVTNKNEQIITTNPASEKTSGYFPGLNATPDYCYNLTAQDKHKVRQE